MSLSRCFSSACAGRRALLTAGQDDLAYELDMARQSPLRWLDSAKARGEQVLVNLFLEAFLLHARSIEGGTVLAWSNNDVIAADFLGRPVRVRMPLLRSSKVRDRLNRRILPDMSYSKRANSWARHSEQVPVLLAEIPLSAPWLRSYRVISDRVRRRARSSSACGCGLTCACSWRARQPSREYIPFVRSCFVIGTLTQDSRSAGACRARSLNCAIRCRWLADAYDLPFCAAQRERAEGSGQPDFRRYQAYRHRQSRPVPPRRV